MPLPSVGGGAEPEARADRAVHQLFARHADELRRYARRIVRSREAAEDVVQEVFLRLWLARDRVELGAGTRAYLYLSTRGRAFDLLADARRGQARLLQRAGEPAGDVEPDPATDDGASPDDGARALVERVIATLPPRQREVARLRVWEQCSTLEVARVLRISPRTVEHHTARVRRALRDAIAEASASMTPP